MTLKNPILTLALFVAIPLGSTGAVQEIPASTDEARLGLLKQASVLLQKKVVDQRDKTLGKVNDLVLDLANGQVLMVLVSSGSEEITPVPARTFSDASLARLVINADKKVFADAPRIAKTGALDVLDENRLGECSRYFGQSRHQSPDGAPARTSSAAGVLGVPVRGQANESLGTLKDIMVDLPLGRIVYFVIEPAADAAAPGTFYVVPPSAVRPGDTAGFLVLKADRGRFLAGPSFQKEFWNDTAFPALATAVRKHYGAVPSSPAEARLVAAAPAPQATPEATVRSDREITQAVLTEIVRDTSGFMSVQIAVTTLNGRVTLSGSVKSEKQKKLIVTAAERVVGPANVDNRLETGVKTKTASL